ncbi:hypothetical protein ACU8DI_08045 [Psychroserpens sp. BH13MA-6]
MKTFIALCFGLLLVGCSSVQLTDYWKNPTIDTYEPYKILVVGITSNFEARQQFESQLKKAFEQRGSQAAMSINYINEFQESNAMTENQLDSLETRLILDEFDTILLTKIIGVEDKIVYKKNYRGRDETYRRFKEEYLMYQDIFYNPDYYEEYTIYHAETSMYCICPSKERELLWKGYINITDPVSVYKTTEDYSKLVMAILEEQQLVPQTTN